MSNSCSSNMAALDLTATNNPRPAKLAPLHLTQSPNQAIVSHLFCLCACVLYKYVWPYFRDVSEQPVNWCIAPHATRHKVNGTHCIHATTERGEQLVHTLQVEVWLLGSVAASGAHQPRFITTERALCQVVYRGVVNDDLFPTSISCPRLDHALTVCNTHCTHLHAAQYTKTRQHSDKTCDTLHIESDRSHQV